MYSIRAPQIHSQILDHLIQPIAPIQLIAPFNDYDSL